MASIYDFRNGEIETARRIRRERFGETIGSVALAVIMAAALLIAII